MEGGPFLTDKIQREFGRFVEIVLHTDGGENAAKHRFLRRKHLQNSANPYYGLFSPDMKQRYAKRGALGPGDDVEEFLDFLRKAPARVAQK